MSVAAPTRAEERAQFERDQGYNDLVSFIISNAVSGEIMAVENYSEMVHLMPDTESKIETVQQAMDETKHILLLQKLGKNLNVGVANEIVEPQWKVIRQEFSEAVRRKDLAAALIIQDIMTESMAVVLYRTLSEGETAKFDPDTAAIAKNILADEEEHFAMGVRRLADLMKEDSDAVHASLVAAHKQVMPQLFSMISMSCHNLCDHLNIDCGSLSLQSIKTDIDEIRVTAAERYIDALSEVGFSPKVTNRLVAEISTYDWKVQQMGISAECDETSGCC